MLNDFNLQFHILLNNNIAYEFDIQLPLPQFFYNLFSYVCVDATMAIIRFYAHQVLIQWLKLSGVKHHDHR